MDSHTISMNALTRWAWGILLVTVLVLRLAGLAQIPLAPDEATTALVSLGIAREEAGSPTGEGSLLTVGNALLFWLAGPGDGLARLLPALSGTLLAAVPILWRRRLGELGALGAAGILGFSPLLLFASRSVSGATTGLLGAALLLTALLAGDDGPVPAESEAGGIAWKDVVAVAGIALGLCGGGVFYDLLIAAVAGWLFLGWIGGKRSPWPLMPRVLLIGGGIAALLSVGFGFHMDWSAIGDGLVAWVRSWTTWGGGLPGALLLDIYEPLTLLLALTGLGWAVARRDDDALALGVVAVVALILGLLHPGAASLVWTALLVPCALLGGYGLQKLLANVPSGDASPVLRWLGLYILVSFIFWMPVGVALAAHVNNASMAAQPVWVLALGGMVLLAIQAMIAILFTMLVPVPLIWRGALLGLLSALLFVQCGAAWGLSFSRAASPAEPAAGVRTSLDVWTLRRILDERAVVYGMRRDAVDLALVGLDADDAAVMRWTLRDFPRMQVLATWPAEYAGFVVAPDGVAPPGESGIWQGMRFVAIGRFDGRIPRCQSLNPPACQDLLDWLLFRDVPEDSVGLEYVVLWERP